MDDQIDRMAEQFTTLSELKMYANAQQHTIVSLSQKIKKLEDENSDLKKQLMNSVPKEKTDNSLLQNELLLGTDQEVIAKIQLNRYKEITLERELSLEETKKVEIFTKILQLGKEKKSTTTQEVNPEQIDTKDLMSMLDSLKNG